MTGKKVLLVEGSDDEHVLQSICRERNIVQQIEIKRQGGVEQLLKNFPVRLKESDIEAIGIILDADTDLGGRWASLKDRIYQFGYENVPDQPDINGTILFPPLNTLLPRLGIWLMPNNKNRGILEDFLRFLIPVGNQLFAHVESCVANIPPNERRFSLLAEPKAIIHTWLAWQKDPGKPMGVAITAKFLDSSVPQVDVLVSWLKRLYIP
jgi:hypothetical protein